MATARERILALLDAVPEDRLDDAEAAIAALTDPVLQAFLSAPDDDEPLTAEDLAAIAEGKADIEHGDIVAWEAYDPDHRAHN
jgi:hypothetical protein